MADPLKPIVLYPEDGTFSPPLALELLPYGLTLNKILINGDGKTHDIVIGPYVLEDVGSSIPDSHNAFLRALNCPYSSTKNRADFKTPS
jgi:hypothetical protein